jgi:ABC-2 type transport system ATP-binding protein
MITLMAKNLVKSFGKITPVNDVSLEVKEGEVFGILGPSGSGKSTILKMLVGMLEPDSGFVRILTYNPLKQKQECMKAVGIVPQHDPLYNELSVWGNIELFGVLYGLPFSDIKKRGERLLDLLGLKQRRDAIAESLSGGERKRLNIILALLHDPRILLLDEPTSGLDPYSKKIVWDIIKSVKNGKTSVIIITHLMDEAQELCDQVAILDRGMVKATGSPEGLRTLLRLKEVVKLYTVPGHKKNYEALERFLLEHKLAEKTEILSSSVKIIGLEKNVMDKVVNHLNRSGERVIDVERFSPGMEEVFMKATAGGREK